MALLSTRPRARILILAAQTGRPSRPDRYLPELWRSGAAAHGLPELRRYRGRVYREAVRSIHTK